MDRSKLEMFDSSIVTSRLVRWGAWKLNSCVALGYPSMSTFMKMTPSASMSTIQDEIDSECKQTNESVLQLNDLHQLIIRNEYVLYSDRKAVERAAITGFKKRQYYDHLKCAHIEIAKRLNLLLISPHTSGINVLSVSEMRLA
ncbi:MAG: hypothetical protein K2Q13_03970 [Nitrosomonas sp.]|uniref:hypothetical protein n=1 Tax=Nitrosomonas sp. TaxID=42353 RepID=UPI0025DCF907|nr:hypothetical protein [Nitrosomonas sp.]MBY0474204.1 hypothetical protein [Nitrosomonas sp.]